jgi:hypothetical protein
MTAVEVLQAFALAEGWHVRGVGSPCYLVEVDRDQAHIVVATMTSKAGNYPARLVFQKSEIPEVLALSTASFQQGLDALRGLEFFRQVKPLGA